MRAGTTTDPGPPFSSGLELRTEGLFAGMIQRSLTPIFTPTHLNITRLRPTRLDDDSPEILVWQDIIRHQPTPGGPLAALEQNPAYGKALTLLFGNLFTEAHPVILYTAGSKQLPLVTNRHKPLDAVIPLRL